MRIVSVTNLHFDWNKQGSKRRPGKPPLAYLQDRHGTTRRNPKPAGWIDHVYRGLFSDGTPFWVAEPYGVNEDDEEDFAYLRANGFVVEVNPACMSRRWNERVTVVLITRKAT